MSAAAKPAPMPPLPCSRLRSKGMFIDVEPDPSIRNTKDGFFWCSLTMTCLGPDGRVCDDGRCDEARPCFDPL